MQVFRILHIGKFLKSLVIPFLLVIVLFSVVGVSLINRSNNSSTNIESKNEDKEVLGERTNYPEIYISNADQGYSVGGMLALASTDKPIVLIGGYQLSGSAEISVYEASEEDLLGYLIHDKEGNQKQKTDIAKLKFITTLKENISGDQGTRVLLPLQEKGIYFLNVKIGSKNSEAYILRSGFGVLAKEGDNEIILWGQDFKSRRSITGGSVKSLNLSDGIKEIQTTNIGNDGIAKINTTPDADIALVNLGDDRAIVPLNLGNLNYKYSYKTFVPKQRLTRYFIFTDRPLYKPGDTVYYKAVLRDDDDVRFTIPSGMANVKIYTDNNEKDIVLEQKVPISSDGTLSGEYKIPLSGKIGFYNLAVSTENQKQRDSMWDTEYSSNSIGFNVEHFRKPEFFIELDSGKNEIVSGDKSVFKIRGEYFSGQPLRGQKIVYQVYASDFYDYEYLADKQSFSSNISDEYRYSTGYGNKTVMTGSTVLDEKGEAIVDLKTKMDFNKGKSQIYTIEATIQDKSQNPSFDRKNILVYAGDWGIYRKDYAYVTKVNDPFKLEIVLKDNNKNTDLSGVKLKTDINVKNWITFQENDQKYPSYKLKEEKLPSVNASTNENGEAVFNLKPDKTGYYEMEISGQDKKGNTISKTFYVYVSDEDKPYYNQDQDNDLTIVSSKSRYLPTENARLKIVSQIQNRDVFLSLERGRVNRYQIVRLNGKSATVDVPLVKTDMPNIYANVSSFSESYLNTNETNLNVTAESRKILINIKPSAGKFGPGETVSVDIETKDVSGNPVSADLAFWAVDKAIFQLSDNRLGDIFETFWNERYNSTQKAHSLEGISALMAEGGGCFVTDTKVIMSDGSNKNIQEIKSGDFVLTRSNEADKSMIKAKVIKVHSADELGYLMFNSNLKVTPNHILWVNNSWKEAGSVQIGDTLTDSKDNKITVKSIEWITEKVKVYNLTVEKYHTYFANNFFVHNDKGMERNAFKDTAYWNPSVHTDQSGNAKVTFKLPDNLTTWTLSAVASTTNTSVGQSTQEIIVGKQIVVRPIIPNILRIGDEVVLSTIVQNSSDKTQKFNIELKFDSGKVENEKVDNLEIKANESTQLYWKVKPDKENSKSKLIFSAKAVNDSKLGDVVTQIIPVKVFGFEEKRAFVGNDNKTYDIVLGSDVDRLKSSINLSLSPTVIGSLPTAIKYLIDYPYGCVEQTISRLVPALIAKRNKNLFDESLKGKDVDKIIEKGLSRLVSLQKTNNDGGWAWWYQGKSNFFVTSYVIEYLIEAQNSGYKVDPIMMNYAKSFTSRYSDQENIRIEDKVSINYAAALLGEKSDLIAEGELKKLTPDLLSIAIMSNFLNGNSDPNTNGLNILISQAKNQGDSIYWEAGAKENFGSVEASTALAIRAILLVKGDTVKATKAVRFLANQRKYDYWANTYASSQVIRALVDFTNIEKELTPKYSYKVLMDDKQLAAGDISDSNQIIKEINIPAENIKDNTSKIAITKNGEGKIYSTLILNEFHTDKKSKALNNGLNIKREYVNEKGSNYSIGVGDTVIVKLTLSGLKTNEQYAVIKDELPSGLIPVNESFNNEQYVENVQQESEEQAVSKQPENQNNKIYDTEVTENGMIISIYEVNPGENTYTYRARVVSEGKFIAPPVFASLMYSPEIYGRSSTQVLSISGKSKFIGKKNSSLSGIGYIIGLIIIIGLFVFLKKKLNSRSDKEKPIEQENK